MKKEELINALLADAKTKNDENLIRKLKTKKVTEAINLVYSLFDEANLTVTENSNEKKLNLYYNIMKALSENYFTIYYVNLRTKHYIGYSSSIDYNDLKIDESGSDFFSDALKNAEDVIYKEDLADVQKFLNVDTVLKNTENGNIITHAYRLILNNVPTYVQLKAMRLKDQEHIIIGISNIDKQKKDEIEYQKIIKKNLTYSKIAFAIAQNYYSIYYVNFNDSSYLEYNIDPANQQLTLVFENDDFFKDSEINAKKLIHKSDYNKFMSTLDKDYIYNELINKHFISLTYRVKINDVYRYSSFKILKAFDDEDHFIVAVSDVDAQMRKENEYKKHIKEVETLAATDALTGALNKYSYNQFESMINEQINNNKLSELAVVLCDINYLKLVNDTIGHDAGDKYIIDAVNILKTVFKNSPIYRIGGDEFVLILEGADYYKRDFLITELTELANKKQFKNTPIIAFGVADYDINDSSLIDVFNRADERMYENKKQLKGL